MPTWAWIGVACVFVALVIFVVGMCMTASRADETLERYRREGHIR